MTQNHGYNQPSEGAKDWDVPLNENFSKLDTDVEVRDSETNLGDYTPESGSKFLATDTGNVFIGDGSSWNELKSFGGAEQPINAIVMLTGSSPGTPTAYRSDGTQISQADDASVVVQSAIDEVASNAGHGIVKIGPGNYNLQDSITVKSNMTIQGAGPGATIFNATGTSQEWVTGSSGVSNVVLRDFRQDGNDSGYRTGVNITDSTDTWLINLDVRNVGDRGSAGDSTPGLRVTGGTRCHIHNCRVERSTSVSIEAAIDAVGCTISNCVVKNPLYNESVNFIHGYSIEKSENCKIVNCYLEDSGPSRANPAYNANNANNAIVAGCTAKDADVGIQNANGPCYANQYVNNNLDNCGISVKAGGSGAPEGTLIANNVIRNAGMLVGKNVTARVANNVMYGSDSKMTITESGPVSIVGNEWRNADSDILYVRVPNLTTEPIIIANNYTDPGTTGSTNDPVVFIEARYGFMFGNVWQQTLPSDSGKPQVKFDPETTPSYWRVENNYFTHNNDGAYCLRMGADGVVTGNIVDTGRVEGVYDGSFTPPAAEVYDNFSLNGADLYLSGFDSTSFPLDETFNRKGTYTGDGTTGRTLDIALTADHVVVEASDGTLYDVHTQFGTGYLHNAPAGELSLSGTTFTIGDNGGDADPNSSGKIYTFYARQ